MLETCLARLAALRRMSFSSKVLLLDLPYPPRPARSILQTRLAPLSTYEPLPFLRIVVLLLLTGRLRS